MKAVFATIALVGAVTAEPTLADEFEFMAYIAKHNKSYGTRAEYYARLARWAEADAFIKEVNAPGSGHTHTAGHNRFSDWTHEEYTKMLGLNTHI